jgi:DNA-binding NarL/FixJ family response regulator
MEDPVAENNPATLVIEMAAGQVQMMLNQWPMSPHVAQMHLKELAKMLASHRPELDVLRVAQSMERAETPSATVWKEFERSEAQRKANVAKEAATKALPIPKVERQRRNEAEITGLILDGYDFAPLSEAEVQLAYMLAHGYTLAQVGRQFNLSVDALKSRLKKAGAKLDLPRSTQSSLVAECLRRNFMPVPPNIPVFHDVTLINSDQRATVLYLSYGMTHAEIATHMKVPEGTVKSRVEWAARNLQVKNNASLLVTIAFANGWLDV